MKTEPHYSCQLHECIALLVLFSNVLFPVITSQFCQHRINNRTVFTLILTLLRVPESPMEISNFKLYNLNIALLNWM